MHRTVERGDVATVRHDVDDGLRLVRGRVRNELGGSGDEYGVHVQRHGALGQHLGIDEAVVADVEDKLHAGSKRHRRSPGRGHGQSLRR